MQRDSQSMARRIAGSVKVRFQPIDNWGSKSMTFHKLQWGKAHISVDVTASERIFVTGLSANRYCNIRNQRTAELLATAPDTCRKYLSSRQSGIRMLGEVLTTALMFGSRVVHSRNLCIYRSIRLLLTGTMTKELLTI